MRKFDSFLFPCSLVGGLGACSLIVSFGMGYMVGMPNHGMLFPSRYPGFIFIFFGSQMLRTVSGTGGMSGHILDFTRRSRNSISSLIKVVGVPSIQRQEGKKRQREKEITYNVGNTRQFQVFAHRLRVP